MDAQQAMQFADRLRQSALVLSGALGAAAVVTLAPLGDDRPIDCPRVEQRVTLPETQIKGGMPGELRT